jgi:hypothetical protein
MSMREEFEKVCRDLCIEKPSRDYDLADAVWQACVEAALSQPAAADKGDGMSKMREAFELWYETTTESEDDLTYHEWMWRSWQAALSTSPLLDKNDQAEGEPFAWLHKITEPDGHETQLLSLGDSNPWSHWLEGHLTECQYRKVPLYAATQPPQPDSNELVELRRDAERYRWIRNNAGFNLDNDYNIGNFQVSQKIKNREAWYYYEEKLDEIIDAALAQSPSVGLNTKKGG